jgi:hypothetical protein
MQLEAIICGLKDLNREFSSGLNMKNYCLKHNLSYTSTSRIFTRGYKTMELRTAYKILGLTPERNISQGIFSTKIQDLIELKRVFERGLL